MVTGTLTSTVTDSSTSMSFVNNTNLNLRKADVTVSYTFKGRPYTLTMGTLRTANQ